MDVASGYSDVEILTAYPYLEPDDIQQALKAELKPSHSQIVEGMRSLRRRVKPGHMSVREMIVEGRRF